MATNVVQQRQMNVASIITGSLANSNGWIQLGNILMQWGQINKTASATNVAVTFSEPFPNTVYNIQLTTKIISVIPGFLQDVASIPNNSAFLVSGASFGVSPPDGQITVFWYATGN